MVWPFSSSNVQTEEVEEERSGYECAPYTVLETAPDYQVFHICPGFCSAKPLFGITSEVGENCTKIGSKISIHEVGNRDNDQVNFIFDSITLMFC